MLPSGSIDQAAADPSPGRRVRRRRLLFAVLGAVAVLIATAIMVYARATDTPPGAASSASPTPTATRKLSVAEVYAALAPSVVSIDAVGAGKVSSGTGVIANADGLVLTARHVVDGAATIRITFADGTRTAASVFADDPAIDIAILAPAGLPAVVVPAILGNPGRLRVGDDVVAIGNPLGLTGTTTAGVVSGLDRSATGQRGLKLSGLIQFDAAVNPGSSGGPLVNTSAEVVGIVVALVNPTGADTFIGIGFAVPIGTAVAAGGEDGPLQ
jgi:S1-C subfamily serine protease